MTKGRITSTWISDTILPISMIHADSRRFTIIHYVFHMLRFLVCAIPVYKVEPMMIHLVICRIMLVGLVWKFTEIIWEEIIWGEIIEIIVNVARVFYAFHAFWTIQIMTSWSFAACYARMLGKMPNNIEFWMSKNCVTCCRTYRGVSPRPHVIVARLI